MVWKIKISHLLLSFCVIALLVLSWPYAPLITLSILAGCCFLLLCQDLNGIDWAIRRWRFGIRDRDPYAKYEPKPKIALILSGVAVLLFVIALITGGILVTNNSPTRLALVVDIVLTGIGLYLSMKAKYLAIGWQNLVAWIPVVLWVWYVLGFFMQGIEVVKG